MCIGVNGGAYLLYTMLMSEAIMVVQAFLLYKLLRRFLLCARDCAASIGYTLSAGALDKTTWPGFAPPGLMILGIAWCLYDRECVYALAILCSAAMMLWICRECLPVPARQMIGRGLAVAWLVVAAAAALLLKKVRRADGMFREMRLLPVSANYALIYMALGVSAVLVVAGMLGAVLAYYALWVAAVAIFAVAVYYTVQQL
jgi:hypothetical protein